MFAPGHLTSLLTLGINTGLVMDVGYTETLVVPVSLTLITVMILSFWTDRPEQTVQIQIRLLLEKPSVQGLH